jgi:hypothetical protein
MNPSLQQYPAQTATGSGQPALYRTQGDPQPESGFGVTDSLKIAEHDHCAEGLGKFHDLCMDRRTDLVRVMLGGIVDDGLDCFRKRIDPGMLERSATRACLPQAQRGPTGHDMKPWAECVTDQQRSSLADEDQECCLECVLDIMPIADERSTYVPHQRGMALDERSQGGFGDVVVIRSAGGLESFEELTVRQACRGTDIVYDPEISEHDAFSTVPRKSRITQRDDSRRPAIARPP